MLLLYIIGLLPFVIFFVILHSITNMWILIMSDFEQILSRLWSSDFSSWNRARHTHGFHYCKVMHWDHIYLDQVFSNCLFRWLNIRQLLTALRRNDSCWNRNVHRWEAASYALVWINDKVRFELSSSGPRMYLHHQEFVIKWDISVS